MGRQMDRPHHLPMRGLCFGFAFLMTCPDAASAQGPSGTPVPEAVVSRMAAAWEAQRTGFVTARIDFDLYRFFDKSAQSLGRDGVVKVLEVLASPQPDFARARQIAGGGTTRLWPMPISLVMDKSAASVKNVWGNGNVEVVNGREDIRQRPGKVPQTDIYAGQSNREMFTTAKLKLYWDAKGLEKYRIISPPVAPRMVIRFARNVEAEGKSVGLATELEFDPKTSSIFALRRYAGDLQHPESESVQIRPVDYGGVEFPTIKVDTDYQNDRVRMMSIYHVKKVVLNDVVDPSEFRVSTPAKSVVIDRRDPAAGPVITSPQAQIDNVVEYANRVVGVVPEGEAQRRRVWPWVALGSGIVCVLVAWRLWAKRGRPAGGTVVP